MRPADMTVLGLLSLIAMGLAEMLIDPSIPFSLDHVIFPLTAAPDWAGSGAEPFGLTMRWAIFGLATTAGVYIRRKRGLPLPTAAAPIGDRVATMMPADRKKPAP